MMEYIIVKRAKALITMRTGRQNTEYSMFIFIFGLSSFRFRWQIIN